MRLFISCLLLALVAALLIPFSASAQTPTEESVCDGLSGASWGLCNAYCEGMDCDSDNPNASSTACLEVLSKYTIHTEQLIPCARVQCPCWAPEDVDTLLSECEGDGLSVTCLDMDLQGQGQLSLTVMECSGERGPVQIIHYLRANIDARFRVRASCASANVPPLRNRGWEISIDQAEACRHVLRDRFGDDVCDSLIISP
jgi:hypothetical protein